MFLHRMSIIGYGIGALAFIASALNAFLLVDVSLLRQIMLFVAISGTIVGFSLVFLGVMARGFERLEAAIKADAEEA